MVEADFGAEGEAFGWLIEQPKRARCIESLKASAVAVNVIEKFDPAIAL